MQEGDGPWKLTPFARAMVSAGEMASLGQTASPAHSNVLWEVLLKIRRVLFTRNVSPEKGINLALSPTGAI